MGNFFAATNGIDLAAAGLLIMVMIGAFSILIFAAKTGVPPMPTYPLVRAKMFRMIPPGFNGTIYELGSGWGTLASPLAKKFPDARIIGIELSPLPYLFSLCRKHLLGRSNLEIRYGNFLKAPLDDADIVVCYLMVGAMKKLEAHLETTAGKSLTVITNGFAMRGWEPEEQVVVPEYLASHVYRYRVGSDHQASRRNP